MNESGLDNLISDNMYPASGEQAHAASKDAFFEKTPSALWAGPQPQIQLAYVRHSQCTATTAMPTGNIRNQHQFQCRKPCDAFTWGSLHCFHTGQHPYVDPGYSLQLLSSGAFESTRTQALSHANPLALVLSAGRQHAHIV